MKKKILVAGLIAGTLFLAIYAQSNGMRQGGMMGGDMISQPQEQQPLHNSNKKYKQGYKQAQITCSQCHAAPNPNQHLSLQWPNIISRMENHIKDFNKIMPNKPALQSIINYYVANSK